ncbi:glycosyltransferase family 4 protein [Halosquirtibacter laminarini]|uniref:Glycosyltransferase family 4 protein n=1 Tax=Halosquirtibacter laminarini TaxID=3374600 RepID=A0AC61ND01_9BACT|nr:glycosyltransferase family 4 protein [Prolixibacteraceae bacterium]
MKKNTILLMGPLPLPITGQSLAFSVVCDSLSGIYVVNTTMYSSKIISMIYVLFSIVLGFLTKRFTCVYFTCSRSKFGGIRDLLLLLCSRLWKVPVVNHLHGFDFYQYSQSLSKIHRKLFIYAYAWVDTSIVLHEDMISEFKDFPKMDITIVENCYDPSLEISPLTSVGIRMKLLYLSNIMQSKGIFILLDAIEKMKDLKNDFELNIAGEFLDDYLMSSEEVKVKFENKVKLLNDNGFRVVYKGVVFQSKKIELLSDSDIFILPTFHRTEAFPISIIEAMRAGCGIISTNHNLIPSIIKDTNGILVEPKSINSLSRGIIQLVKDQLKVEKLKFNNVLEAKNKYSPLRYIKEVNDIIIR